MTSIMLTALLLLGEPSTVQVSQDSLAIHRLILESVVSKSPQRAIALDRRILDFKEGSEWYAVFRGRRTESYIQHLIDLDLIQGLSDPIPRETRPVEEWSCRGNIDTTVVAIGPIRTLDERRAECIVWITGVTYMTGTRENWRNHNPYINILRYSFEHGEQGWQLVDSTLEFEVSLAPYPPPNHQSLTGFL